MKHFFKPFPFGNPAFLLFFLSIMLCSQGVVAQNLITGKVRDGQEALVGATVKAFKNGVLCKGAITDINGLFKIAVDTGWYDLEISFTGLQTQRISAVHAGQGITNIPEVELASSVLTEVVIVSYKIPNVHQDFTTAAYSVKSEKSRKKSGKKTKAQVSAAPHRKPRVIAPEASDPLAENPFQTTAQNNISTFSIDVDPAAYAHIRHFLDQGKLPPTDAVRIEEMINYFDYQYTPPAGQHPFEVSTEVAPCPWNTDHRLLRIGLQGQQIDVGQLPAANLVFLIDVSGSMLEHNKLPLVKSSLYLLVDQLRPNDRVAMVVYAGAAGLVLNSTAGTDKGAIKQAIEKLQAGGSTAGGAGIQLAYQTARQHFIAGGNNRVILCTDGDFNVGVSSEQDLVGLIEKERQDGIYLTVLGFGMGNYQDRKMQSLADKGNGNHAYIDRLQEAEKVFVKEFGATLFAIAKDVKLQLHFNPRFVAGYRLIGYENRMLATEDFDDDTKDAGELGAGHQVTALYELIPAGQTLPPLSKADSALVVVQTPSKKVNMKAEDLMVMQLRYKKPQGNQPSRLMEYRLNAAALERQGMSDSFKLASAVAEFGLLLRQSKYRGHASFQSAIQRAKTITASNQASDQADLIRLMEVAAGLTGSN